MRSIFWEFEISIWLNALCRAVSLIVFVIALCRIGDVVKQTQGINVNGSMLCLNWTYFVFEATVQVSLMIFYALGLIYDESSVFQGYTTVMMYVNVAATCISQVILSFVFAKMSEHIELREDQVDGKNVVKVTREGKFIYEWEQDAGSKFFGKVNGSINDNVEKQQNYQALPDKRVSFEAETEKPQAQGKESKLNQD